MCSVSRTDPGYVVVDKLGTVKEEGFLGRSLVGSAAVETRCIPPVVALSCQYSVRSLVVHVCKLKCSRVRRSRMATLLAGAVRRGVGVTAGLLGRVRSDSGVLFVRSGGTVITESKGVPS